MCFSFHLKPNSNSFCAVIGFPGLTLFTMATNLNKSRRKSDSEGNYWHFNWSRLVCLRVLKDKRSATLLVALHDYLSPDLRVKRRCHVRRVLPGYSGVSGEFLLTVALLIHWCVYESYCSFFFCPSSKASFLVGMCVSRRARLCVCVWIYLWMSVCVLACWYLLGPKQHFY